MPATNRGDCKNCNSPIIRCESCHERYSKLDCYRCTYGVSVALTRKPIQGHVDEERDEDANGGLSNARRALEDRES